MNQEQALQDTQSENREGGLIALKKYMLQTFRLGGCTPIIHVNKQSRAVALGKFFPNFHDIMPHPIYMHPFQDTLTICDHKAVQLLADIDCKSQLASFIEMLLETPLRSQYLIIHLTLAFDMFSLELKDQRLFKYLATLRNLETVKLQIAPDAPEKESSSVALIALSSNWLPYWLASMPQHGLTGASESVPKFTFSKDDILATLRGLGGKLSPVDFFQETITTSSHSLKC